MNDTNCLAFSTAGISFEVDVEMMYMAYDMEEKSVDKATAEIIES